MVYVTGDMHGFPDRLHRTQLTADDTLIVCGDLGYGMNPASAIDFFIEYLASKPYTVLFIDGNHDNHERLAELPEEWRYGGRVHRVRDNVFHLMRGQIYTIEDRTFFTLGGAASRDKHYRQQRGLPWWPEEVPSAEELMEAAENLETVGWRVDTVLTHTAPRVLMEQLQQVAPPDEAPLTAFLDALWQDLQFNEWYFGHWHVDTSPAEGVYAVHETILPVE